MLGIGSATYDYGQPKSKFKVFQSLDKKKIKGKSKKERQLAVKSTFYGRGLYILSKGT